MKYIRQAMPTLSIAALLFMCVGLLLLIGGWTNSHTSAHREPIGQPSGQSDPCMIGGQIYCAIDPRVSDDNLDKTVCNSAWLLKQLPPDAYVEELKVEQLLALDGVSDIITARASAVQYEEDHRIPLGLGGYPGDPIPVPLDKHLKQDPTKQWNLSPEQGASPNAKDAEEIQLHELVCDGDVSLGEAQRKLIQDWLGPYPGYKT